MFVIHEVAVALPKVKLDKTRTLQNIGCQENNPFDIYFLRVVRDRPNFILNVWYTSNGNVNSLPRVMF